MKTMKTTIRVGTAHEQANRSQRRKDKARMEVARAISMILKHEKDGAAPAELVEKVGDFSTELYDLIADDSPEILYECLRRYERQ